MQALALGILQGLTEFLPVSSSGHLVLGGVVAGLKEPHLLFDVVVHLATLLAVVVFYRRAILEIGAHTLGAGRDLLRGASFASTRAARPGAWLLWLVALGTVPTGLLGVLFKDQLEALFASPRMVAGALLATAALLFATRFVRKNDRLVAQLTARDALLVGLVQGFAIVPGISRSGSTIAVALFLGLDRELAARYSFLLAIPAILGAVVLHVRDLGALVQDGLALGVGFVVAMGVGLASLALFIPLVQRGRLHYFSAYLIPVGLLALVLLP